MTMRPTARHSETYRHEPDGHLCVAAPACPLVISLPGLIDLYQPTPLAWRCHIALEKRALGKRAKPAPATSLGAEEWIFSSVIIRQHASDDNRTQLQLEANASTFLGSRPAAACRSTLLGHLYLLTRCLAVSG